MSRVRGATAAAAAAAAAATFSIQLPTAIILLYLLVIAIANPSTQNILNFVVWFFVGPFFFPIIGTTPG